MIDYDVKQIFAERLKLLIEEKNLSVKQFAEKIGIADSTISDWLLLKTVPSILNIPKIALFFGVSTDYLLGLEN